MVPLRRIIGNQRGVAAMEFGLVAPVLLLIVFATIDYGWYMTQWIVVNNAVSAGARAGVKAREWETESHEAEDPVEFARQAVKEALWTVADLPDEYIDIDPLDADDNAPRRLRVRIVDLPYRPITGYLGEAMLPGTLAAMAVMAFP